MNPLHPAPAEIDLNRALDILDRCAKNGFHTLCDQELLRAFAGRADTLASALAHLGEQIALNSGTLDHHPWFQAIATPPYSEMINMFSTVAEQAQSAQDRWGRHILSLTPLGFSTDTPYYWVKAARAGQLSSLLAIEAVVSSIVRDDFPLADSSDDSVSGHSGIALAFAKDGPDELALVSKFLAQGRFSSRHPVLSFTDLFSAQAHRCAQAVLDAGIPIGPALFGPHGEHGLLPSAAVAARHLWLTEHLGSAASLGVQQALKLSFEATRRTIASLSASRALSCGKFDTLSGLQIIRARRNASEGDYSLSHPDLDLLFEQTCALPRDNSDPRALAQATGKLLGTLFSHATCESDPIDMSIRAPAWKIRAKAEIERVQKSGINLAGHADTLCARAMESAYDYSADGRSRDEICSMVMDTLSECAGAASIGPESLYWLARDGRVRLATRLFEQGCRADFDHPHRGTILHELADNNTKSAASLFLAIVDRHPELADRPARGGYHKGRHPIHMACKRLDSAMIDALINAGASPNATDGGGQTPLRYLLSKRGHVSSKTSHIVAKKLIEAGADPELRDARGRTPA